MTLEIAFVLMLVVAAVILFALEKIPAELTALIIMTLLILSGVLSPEEGISGFSNTATITVGAMFIISAALKKTGAVGFIGLVSVRLFRFNFITGLICTMIAVGAVSAFINNTPVVAIFIPILLNVGSETRLNPGKLLMPVSFASMFGGVCTLIGTSTNILVSTIVVKHKLPPLGMFEFLKLGLIFFAIGLVYMTLVGVRLIPERECCPELTARYRMNDYLTDLILMPTAKSIGMRLPDSHIVSELEVDVLEVIRNKKRLLRPLHEIILEAGDVLRVRCDIKQIHELKRIVGVMLKSKYSLRDKDFEDEQLVLVEAIVAPNSNLLKKTIKSSRFRNTYQANALAVRHRGQLFHVGFSKMPLSAGDAILIEVRMENYEALMHNSDFVIVSDVEIPVIKKRRLFPVLSVIAAVVGFASSGILPIVTAAIGGCILLVLIRSLSVEEAFEAVEWRVIFLLAGIISLGVAMEKTGAALLLSKNMIRMLEGYGPVVIVAAIYLLTTLLTNVMSNNATAILLTPIAITSAINLGLNPKPFIMAVAFASSASFMTPVGYQTNSMIYGVGQYRFSDFLRVGTPLNVLFWIAAILFIPVFFPF